MSQDFFDIEKGLQIDDSRVILTGTAAPGGTTDTDAADEGSLFLRGGGTNGIYEKSASGSGTDKWNQLATQEFVTQNTNVLDIKASVKLATTDILDNIGNGVWTRSGTGVGHALTAGSAGTTTMDTIVLADNDEVLVKDEDGTGTNLDAKDNGIYVVSNAGAGSATVLTRRTDFDEDNEVTAMAMVGVDQGGANADKWYYVNSNDPIVVDTNDINWDELPSVASLTALQTEVDNIETSLGACVAANGTFVAFSGTNHIDGATSICNAIELLDTEIGADTTSNIYTTGGAAVNANIDALDAALGDARFEFSNTNVTTLTVLDSFNVDTVAAATWLVHVQGNLEADAAKKRSFELHAIHDGHNVGASPDATDTDYTVFAKLKMGSALTGLSFNVDLNGSGGSQVMRLTATSTTAVDIRGIREVINF